MKGSKGPRSDEALKGSKGSRSDEAMKGSKGSRSDEAMKGSIDLVARSKLHWLGCTLGLLPLAD